MEYQLCGRGGLGRWKLWKMKTPKAFFLSKNTCVYLCNGELYSRAFKRDSESTQYENGLVVYLRRIYVKIIGVFLMRRM